MQRAATGLLLLVAALFVVARVYEARFPWLQYVRAFAEAAMVGGIADWFAVTALFRHPLGIPIPHTAIVPARKERIGQALGQFVQRHFLAEAVVREKLRAMQPGRRAAEWLLAPGNSRLLTTTLARTAASAAQAVPATAVDTLIDRAVVQRLRTVPAAPVAAQLLAVVSAGGLHQRLLNDVLRVAAQYLEAHEDDIRGKLKSESPWWVPGIVENRLGNRLLSGLEQTLTAVAADPLHPLRQRVDEAVARFQAALRDSPELVAKAEAIKVELLAHPAVAALGHRIWTDTSAALAAYADRAPEVTDAAESPDAESPDAEAPDAAAAWVRGLAQRMLEEPALMARVDDWLVSMGIALVERSRDEVGALIASTVASWDADATSRRIELQIGRDLQFIRINGTLVGGVVGVLLHLIATRFSA